MVYAYLITAQSCEIIYKIFKTLIDTNRKDIEKAEDLINQVCLFRGDKVNHITAIALVSPPIYQQFKSDYQKELQQEVTELSEMCDNCGKLRVLCMFDLADLVDKPAAANVH